MDGLLIYLFAAVSVAVCIPFTEGSKEGFSVGIALRQGEPSSVIAQKNGDLLMNCSVEYDNDLGPLNIVWIRDGEPIDLASKRVQVLQNGSLYFRRIIHRPKKDKTDEGHYKCLATLQKVGTVIARDVRVQVAGIERKFSIEPQPQKVPLGSVARFQCEISAVPSAMYIWELDKTKLPQTDDRYLLLSSGILQITGVRMTDAGLYRCYATQGLHELPGVVSDIDGKYSEEAKLDVVTDPVADLKIVSSSQNVTALAGTKAVLECLVQGYTGQVEWKKDGQKLSVQSTGRLEMQGSNLLFLKTELSDHGKYQCVAGTAVANMMLNVVSSPIITEMPESVSNPKATWIYLKCLAGGHPKPTITWLKDGKEIVWDKYNYQKRTRFGDELVIVQSDLHNSGYYQCVASNDVGSTMAVARIDVYMQPNVPGVPTNLRAVIVSSNNILVKWDPAQAAVEYPVLAYTVHYKKVGASVDKDHVINVPQIELKELSPFSEYAIYVAAYSKGGAGPKSDRLLVRTKETVPSKAPTILLEPRSMSILVKWEPLAEAVRNGIINRYKIFYRIKGDSLSMKVDENVPGTVTSYVIRDLKPDTEYEVRVLAGTSVGYQTFLESQWPWVPVTTESGPYIVAPEIQVMPINTTVVNVTWVYTSDTDISSIKLELKTLPGSNLVNVTTLTPDARHHVLQNLDEDNVYEIVVIVETVDGTSSQAVEEIRTSDIPLPPTPKNLQVTLRTSDSIAVTWFQMESPLEITHFVVRYSQWSDRGLSSKTKYFSSETNSALLEGLLPFTQYQIAVRAHTEAVFSKYSNPIIEKTGEGVPSEPQNLQIKSVEPGSVSIEWAPPAEPNGYIVSYIIMYTNSLDENEDTWARVTKNGTEHSATIAISDTASKTYYFMLQASTGTGLGKPTSPIPVSPFTTTEAVPVSNEDDQRLGIIIGISIGVFCIIICVIIILLRHKCLTTANYNQQPQTQPARFHGNGHIPGNGNGHAIATPENRQSMGLYEMDAYTPMLDHLPENEDSDSKGGGGGNVILTPNGAKLNGFVPLKKNGVKNGQVHCNGHMPSHMTTFLPNQYKGEVMDVEETRGLIAAMLGGGTDRCITAHVGEEGFTPSRFEDLGSLDDIDHSSCEDVVHKSQVMSSREDSGKGSGDSGKCSGDSDTCVCDSGEGSISDSRNSGVYSAASIPRSDTTDTGDTVVFCGSGVCRTALTSGGDPMDNVLPEQTSVNELPLSPSSSRFSSSSCEDTCHDGGTMHGEDLSQIPQIQLSTSEYSQAPGSDAVVTGDNCFDPVTRSSCNSTSPPPATILVANGVPAATSRYRNNGDPAPHLHSNNGVPPQLYSNGGVQWPQGDNRLSSAENNPIIPHSPLPRETILSHGTRDSTLETLAQIPQDAVESATVNSPPRKHHYQV